MVSEAVEVIRGLKDSFLLLIPNCFAVDKQHNLTLSEHLYI